MMTIAPTPELLARLDPNAPRARRQRTTLSPTPGDERRARAATLPLTARSSKPIDAPFTIAIDTAEQLPYTFTALNADAAQLHRPLVVRTVRKALKIGTTKLSIDYSIEGYEGVIGIERKSHEDFCNTVAGKHRDRFESKLALINGGVGLSAETLQRTTFRRFAVVVEAEWSTIIDSPPEHSAAVPRTLFRSVLAWQERYPLIHWLFLSSRERAEQATFRVLERWWKENVAGRHPQSPPHPAS